MTELVAEQDEVLLEHYVNNGGLTDDMLVQGLRIGVCRRTLVPVVEVRRCIIVGSICSCMVSSACCRHRSTVPGRCHCMASARQRQRPVQREPRATAPPRHWYSRRSSIHLSGDCPMCGYIRERWRQTAPCTTPPNRCGSEGGTCSPCSGKISPIARAVAGDIVAIES